MAFASLGLTDSPPVGTMIIGIAVLVVAIAAYENWRLIRATRLSGYRGAGLRGAYPRLPWQELFRWMQALRVSMYICFAVALIAMCAVGSIETAALTQPKIADAQFVHPHNIKGAIRFFTDREERLYAVAKPLMISFGAVFFALMFVVGRVEENCRERKQQDLLDRIATEM
jgi:hypothetical protein